MGIAIISAAIRHYALSKLSGLVEEPSFLFEPISSIGGRAYSVIQDLDGVRRAVSVAKVLGDSFGSAFSFCGYLVDLVGQSSVTWKTTISEQFSKGEKNPR